MGKKLILFIFVLFLMPSVAIAWCIEPSAPYSKPSKPSVPFCVNEWNNTHTCSDWEISSYNSSISSYNNEISNYIRDLQNYVNDASSYASCEIESID